MLTFGIVAQIILLATLVWIIILAILRYKNDHCPAATLVALLTSTDIPDLILSGYNGIYVLDVGEIEHCPCFKLWVDADPTLFPDHVDLQDGERVPVVISPLHHV